jgi:hypothetical protein
MNDEMTPSQRIDEYIAGVTDWRGEMLARIRHLVHEAAPKVTEEWKWGSPVWSQNGMICSASAFRDHVKVNFFKGASLQDPKGLFNAGLEAKATRAIDFHEGEKIDEAALKDLVHSAVAHNASGTKKK